MTKDKATQNIPIHTAIGMLSDNYATYNDWSGFGGAPQELVLDVAEVNQRMSLFTAHREWRSRFHEVNLGVPAYLNLFRDTWATILKWNNGEWDGGEEDTNAAIDIAERIFYAITTSPKDTMSLATLASKLDTDCQMLSDKYEENIQLYSDLIYALRNVGIFSYRVSVSEHPILTPALRVNGELRDELDAKFSQALPQIGGVVGEMDPQGYGLLPGIPFKGMSTKRKTPLNSFDREIVSLVSRQQYLVDMDILNTMEYYVPTITETGLPISLQEQEDARIAYNRFKDMALEAWSRSLTIQLPTTQDSRGRFYNAATDPAVRLSLRSIQMEGSLSPFEYRLLGE